MQNEQPDFSRPHHMRDFDGTHGTVMHASGDQERDLLITFFSQPYLMEYLSQQLGHLIYQDRIFTRILAPGNNKTVWVHQTKGIKYDTATDPDSGEYHTVWEKLDICENGDQTEPDKYPRAWARFLKKGIQLNQGFAIEEWGAIPRSMAESLKSLNIPTVEALAALSDARAAEIMGGRKWRDQARATLDERRRNEIVSREQEKASRAEEQVKVLTGTVEELRGIISQMQSEFAAAIGQSSRPIVGLPNPEPPKPQLKQISVKSSRRAQNQMVAQAGEDAA